MMATTRRSLLRIGLAVAFATPAIADDLAQPKGKVVLIVSGAIARINSPSEARFDLELLESLPQRSYTTTTIWTTGKHTYSGVLLRDLLYHVGARGHQIEAIALNDYSVQFPLDSVTDEAPLLAYRQDGEQMAVRDKGPIWLIYPFDSDPAYRTDETHARAVWQLIRLEVKD